jgi:hypothetical protein
MKRQLCAAIDGLTDDRGFVLVVSDDQLVFTPIRASTVDWSSDAYLDIEQLSQAELRSETQKLRSEQTRLALTNERLKDEVAAAEARLADLNAAISNALGGETPTQNDKDD